MPVQKVTVNSRKYDRSIRRSWQCELVSFHKSRIELIGKFDLDVSHPGLGDIKRGTISHEYFWFDRWYNVFCFHEPNGDVRNYYCNLAMPPTFVEGVLDYVDLDIDVVVWPDKRHEVVDRDDFEKNAVKYGYTDEMRQHAEASVEELIAMIDVGIFPFTD